MLDVGTVKATVDSWLGDEVEAFWPGKETVDENTGDITTAADRLIWRGGALFIPLGSRAEVDVTVAEVMAATGARWRLITSLDTEPLPVGAHVKITRQSAVAAAVNADSPLGDPEVLARVFRVVDTPDADPAAVMRTCYLKVV